jgi:hypothetical protein
MLFRFQPFQNLEALVLKYAPRKGPFGKRLIHREFVAISPSKIIELVDDKGNTSVLLKKMQEGNQYSSSSFIIEISPPGVKNQGGKRFRQEGLVFVSSTVISRSSKVRKVDLFSPWKRTKPRLLFL